MAVQEATANKVIGRRSPFRLTERRREYITFVLFALPNVTLLAIWTYWPFVYSLYLSITNWNLLKPVKQIVGLSNYQSLLASPAFRQVAQNTVIYMLGTVFLRLGIALALAVLLNQWLLGRGFWRTIIFSPHITTSAAMALVWLAMYDPIFGPVAAVLGTLGVTFPNVIGSTTWALPAVMLVGIWKAIGFSTVVFLAALQGVSKDLKDAASVDGANAWQSFWHVSFPAISPITYFLLTTGLIEAFQTFDLVSVMTSGGPANHTNVYVYYLYREAFHYTRMGTASAVAVIFFVIIMVFTYLQTRAAERWVHY